MSYGSGVYHHVTGQLLGGHAVKLIGWGHDDKSGFDYWICANSWDTTWGEKGFFNIKWDDCGINSSTYSCTPVATA